MLGFNLIVRLLQPVTVPVTNAATMDIARNVSQGTDLPLVSACAMVMYELLHSIPSLEYFYYQMFWCRHKAVNFLERIHNRQLADCQWGGTRGVSCGQNYGLYNDRVSAPLYAISYYIWHCCAGTPLYIASHMNMFVGWWYHQRLHALSMYVLRHMLATITEATELVPYHSIIRSLQIFCRSYQQV